MYGDTRSQIQKRSLREETKAEEKYCEETSFACQCLEDQPDEESLGKETEQWQ